MSLVSGLVRWRTYNLKLLVGEKKEGKRGRAMRTRKQRVEEGIDRKTTTRREKYISFLAQFSPEVRKENISQEESSVNPEEDQENSKRTAKRKSREGRSTSRKA